MENCRFKEMVIEGVERETGKGNLKGKAGPSVIWRNMSPHIVVH